MIAPRNYCTMGQHKASDWLSSYCSHSIRAERQQVKCTARLMSLVCMGDSIKIKLYNKLGFKCYAA